MQILLVALTIVLIAIDQLTKHWAELTLAAGKTIEIWHGVFELRYCRNEGVAFSLLQDQRWVFIPLTLFALALIVVLLFRSEMRKSRLFCLSCILIFAGGVGNMIDRFAYRYVIDFLYFRLIDFPIFNFADCCVTVGAVLLFVYLLFFFKETENKPLYTVLFGIERKPKKGTADDGTSGE